MLYWFCTIHFRIVLWCSLADRPLRIPDIWFVQPIPSPGVTLGHLACFSDTCGLIDS